MVAGHSPAMQSFSLPVHIAAGCVELMGRAVHFEIATGRELKFENDWSSGMDLGIWLAERELG
jgi:hypothetical protein